MKIIIIWLNTILSFLILLTISSCTEGEDSIIIFPSSPYLGITRTLEGGPEPIGEWDETDWLDIPESGVSIFPAYPNPSDSVFNLGFSVNYSQRGFVYLHHQLTNQLMIVADDEFLAGRYEIKVNLKDSKFQKGMIRAYFRFGKGISWGDIFYR